MDNIPTYSRNLFSWEGNHGAIEASCLSGSEPFLGQTEGKPGLLLEGQEDPTPVLFLLDRHERHCGELTAWHLISQDGTLSVTVFND